MKRAAYVAAVMVALGVGWFALGESAPPTQLIGGAPEALEGNDGDGAGVSLVVQADNPGIEEIGAGWYFNWYFVPHDDVQLPFVPLVCGYPGGQQVSDSHLREVDEAIRGHPDRYPDGTLFLIGNEIGYTHQQDGRSASEYAEDFHRCSTLLRSINPTFEVSVGPTILSTDSGITDAIVDAEDGIDYLAQVMDAYEASYGTAIPADWFAATNHVLEANNAELEVFEQRLVDLRTMLADRGLQERGVILTEYGVPTRGSSPEEIERFLVAATRIVATMSDPEIGHPDDGRLVQRYAWFTARPLSPIEKLQSLGFGAFFLQLAQTSLYDADGSLTHLGHAYRAMVR